MQLAVSLNGFTFESVADRLGSWGTKQSLVVLGHGRYGVETDRSQTLCGLISAQEPWQLKVWTLLLCPFYPTWLSQPFVF